MSLNVSTEVEEYDQIAPGLYPGALIWVLDLFLQPGYTEGTFSRQVFFNFEVKTPEGPKTIGAFYTVSFNAKANLGNMLRGWIGALPAEIDLEALVGKGCNLHIVEGPSGKSKVSAVMSGDYVATLDKLTTADSILAGEWFQNKIEEGAARIIKKGLPKVPAPTADTSPTPPPFEDNIPL